MATIQTIDATMLASSHPDIAKRISFGKAVASVIMLLAGILAFVATTQIEDRSSASYMGVMVLGTVLILVGVFFLFWKSRKVVYLPTGSAVKEQSIYFDLRYMDPLKNTVSSGSFSADSVVRSEPRGNVRMDVVLSDDRKFAAVQLFQFVPYNYQPIMPVKYFTDDAAAAVAAFLEGCKQQR